MAAEKEKPKETAEAAKPAASGQGGWLPVIVILVLVPALSYAMAEFVLFPRLEKRIAAATAAAAATTEHRPATKGEPPKGEASFSYEFKDIVSNLAGSMKSRYIKVSFTAYSANPELGKIVEANKAKILDTTLGVLASLALPDLEDPTVKNKVRNQLVYSYESVLKSRVIEEIYFSEFVIQ